MSRSLLCPLAQPHLLILFRQQNAKQSLIIWRGDWSLKMNAVKLRYAGFLPIFLHTEKSGSIYHLYYITLWFPRSARPSCSKAFKGKFFLFFTEHPMIKLQAKRFEPNFLLKLSDLKSNFTLTLVCLNSASNNQAWMLILPSSCYAFPCKLIARILH